MIKAHPEYLVSEWTKYRFIKDGGDDFIEQYLVKFSAREDDDDFIDRKAITPIPGFANAALTDVRNAIYQRMCDIVRTGGSEDYQKTIAGAGGGVDLTGATMNSFVGREVLPELLFMGKVGVYVDMPEFVPSTKEASANLHPYVYIYAAEDIINWVYTTSEEGVVFERLLLQESYVTDDELGLPSETKTRLRLMVQEENGVSVTYLDEKGKKTDEPVIMLDIDRIPFVLFELDRSLLKDVANHQIALLNLESSDIAYALTANFPFITEQTAGKFAGQHLKSNEDAEENEVEVGSIQGRRYAPGMDRPGFIHPSAEPLNASIDKQRQLKEDIRSLINLALSSIRPKFASAEAKQFDERGLESGLSFLGLVLERGEQQIAQLFSLYEKDTEIATVNYPERYGLKTDLQRLAEAKQIDELTASVPSQLFQKHMSKEVVRILLSAKVSIKDLSTMLKEVDAAAYMTSDAVTIHSDIERGLVSLETAALARGYNADEPKKAEIDHAARLVRIKEAQSTAVLPDEIDNPAESGRAEKEASQDPDKKE